MNKLSLLVPAMLILIVVGGIGVYMGMRSESSATPTPSQVVTATPHPLIRVSTPLANAVIKSPVEVAGTARGTWYFEASFPVKIYDDYGRLLGSVPAQAQSEWMTEDFVPFKASLTFATPSTATGKIVFEKDNPSGLPQYADQIEVPVRFDLASFLQRTVQLYYYDANKDKDENGNILCSSKGLVAVSRQISATLTPIQDTIRLLLQGSLTATEKSQGVTTEYPLSGFSLANASLANNTLTLTFNDPQNRSGGGSCRSGILWAQIEATAKQFPGVSSVKFMPEELFQP